ncbi:hypothetical protein CCMA1212_005631, partial [Trichoderma ghanense]
DLHTNTRIASNLFDPAQHHGISSRLDPFTDKSSDQKFMWLAATRPLGEGRLLPLVFSTTLAWTCVCICMVDGIRFGVWQQPDDATRTPAPSSEPGLPGLVQGGWSHRIASIASHRIAHGMAWHDIHVSSAALSRPQLAAMRSSTRSVASPLLHTSNHRNALGGRGQWQPVRGPEPCNARYTSSSGRLLEEVKWAICRGAAHLGPVTCMYNWQLISPAAPHKPQPLAARPSRFGLCRYYLVHTASPPSSPMSTTRRLNGIRRREGKRKRTRQQQTGRSLFRRQSPRPRSWDAIPAIVLNRDVAPASSSRSDDRRRAIPALDGGRRSRAILAQQAICTSPPFEAPSSTRNGLRLVLAPPLGTVVVPHRRYSLA